jgi:hypothetical protein
MLAADRAVFHTTAAGLEDDSVAERLGHELGARARPQLGHGVAHMRASGVTSYVQLVRHLPPTEPVRHEAHDLALALEQPPRLGLGRDRAAKVPPSARRAQRDEQDQPPAAPLASGNRPCRTRANGASSAAGCSRPRIGSARRATASARRRPARRLTRRASLPGCDAARVRRSSGRWGPRSCGRGSRCPRSALPARKRRCRRRCGTRLPRRGTLYRRRGSSSRI